MNKKILIHILPFFFHIISAQESSSLVKEVKPLPDGKFLLIEKNTKGDTIIKGTLSSNSPETKNGEFIFYYNNIRKPEAKGYYVKNIPTGIWEFYDTNGIVKKSLDYGKVISFLNADTINPKGVYLVVEKNPYYLPDTLKEDSKPNTKHLYNYLNENMVYPIYAAKNKISGTVYLRFVVSEQGKICKIEIARSSGNLDLNLEAIRIVIDSSPWHPGSQSGISVPVYYTLPVKFTSK